MGKSSKVMIILVISLLIVFLGAWGIISLTSNVGQTQTQVSLNTATSKLENLLKKIDVYNIEPRMAQVDLAENDIADELPNISKYPLNATGTAPINIEIFSSTEKSGTGTDGWLIEVANNFNRQGYEIDGQKVSVSVRYIASGAAIDYIVSGKYVPDAFTPSNEMWGALLEAKSVKVEMVSDGIAKNVTGILFEKNKYNQFIENHGSVSMQSIVSAAMSGELNIGYTNPFPSSTGLNFLVTTLNTFDGKDILSDTAQSQFEEFQKHIPFVVETTIQMRDAAKSGALDVMLQEYQTYSNSEDKSKYVFTPFGMRHDSPMYAIGNLSDNKHKVLEMFTEYCLNSESQNLATKYGFNNNPDYVSEVPTFSGSQIIQAQNLWKDKKDGGRPVVAVFVADISGSMEGAPINELKRSLVNGSQYINKDNSIGLVSYNRDVFINLPIGKFDINQRALFNGAVEDLSATLSTATYDAILVACDMLLKEKENQPDAKLMIFLLSDGEQNYGTEFSELKPVITGLGIPIHTIGYNADINALQQISSINEASSTNANSDDVIYVLKNMFNSQM